MAPPCIPASTSLPCQQQQAPAALRHARPREGRPQRFIAPRLTPSRLCGSPRQHGWCSPFTIAAWTTLIRATTGCGKSRSMARASAGSLARSAIVLPRLLVSSYGQDDPDFLFLLLGPIYTIAGSVLVVVSLISRRCWMKSMRSMSVRTLLLAAAAILLSLLWPLACGPRMWDTPPYGFDLTAFSWIVGIGLFFAGSRFAPKGQPHPAQLM